LNKRLALFISSVALICLGLFLLRKPNEEKAGSGHEGEMMSSKLKHENQKSDGLNVLKKMVPVRTSFMKSMDDGDYEVNDLLRPTLSPQERNVLEHKLVAAFTALPNEKLIEELADGLELLNEESLLASHPEVYDRFLSLIRVAGLRRLEGATRSVMDLGMNSTIDSKSRETVYEALSYLLPTEGEFYLRRQIEAESDEYLKAQAMLSLGNYGKMSDFELFTGALGHSNADIEASGISCIAKLKKQGSETLLFEAFSKVHEQNKVLIIDALSEFKTVNSRKYSSPASQSCLMDGRLK
jgi:hypothetical protein